MPNEQAQFSKKEMAPYEMGTLDTIIAIDKRGDMKNWDYDYFVEAGRVAIEAKAYVQWFLGKMAYHVAHYHNITTDQYANDMGVGRTGQTLRQYSSVYQTFVKADPNFSPNKYCGAMPWGVIAYVAGKVKQVDKNPVELLDSLANKGVASIAHAHREVQKEVTGVEMPKKPTAKFKCDLDLRKWRLRFIGDDIEGDIDWFDFVKTYWGFIKHYVPNQCIANKK